MLACSARKKGTSRSASFAPELTAGLRVVVELGCVRNSLGAEAFVADEVVRGHAGKQ